MLDELKNIYFIGIGGIGMSALARYFHQKGVKVTGYDRSSTPLTQQLVAEGIDIRFEEDVASAPKDAELIVYTPAIPSTHTELNYYVENGYVVKKRAEVLGLLTQGKFTIAIGGSHGKTTVTSMVSHILHQSGYGCTAFVGGIMSNYQSNFLSSNKEVIVVEADEFDRSFLQLHPDILVITAVDTDHLDIYGSRAAIEATFEQFTKQIKPNGQLFIKAGESIVDRLQSSDILTYHLTDTKADFYTKKLSIIDGDYSFCLNNLDHKYQLGMGGRHNIENALVAILVAQKLGIESKKISQALATFKGIKRRFEYKIRRPNLIMIDDYAHHPAELSALIGSVRALYPNKKITTIFQPHLYSRTKDLAVEFAESLDLSDEVVVLDIYPARELPIEGVTSNLIYEKIKLEKKHIFKKEYITTFIKAHTFEVVLTVGAGSIDKFVTPIQEILLEKAMLV